MKCVACVVADGELDVSARTAICRRCAATVGHFLLHAPDVTLSALWNETPDAPPRPQERALEDFKAQIAEFVTADSPAHLDLASAYAEMGLACDAIRSAAQALSAEAAIAQRAVDLIFGEHARPDALAYTLRAMRTSN